MIESFSSLAFRMWLEYEEVLHTNPSTTTIAKMPMPLFQNCWLKDCCSSWLSIDKNHVHFWFSCSTFDWKKIVWFYHEGGDGDGGDRGRSQGERIIRWAFVLTIYNFVQSSTNPTYLNVDVKMSTKLSNFEAGFGAMHFDGHSYTQALGMVCQADHHYSRQVKKPLCYHALKLPKYLASVLQLLPFKLSLSLYCFNNYPYQPVYLPVLVLFIKNNSCLLENSMGQFKKTRNSHLETPLLSFQAKGDKTQTVQTWPPAV